MAMMREVVCFTDELGERIAIVGNRLGTRLDENRCSRTAVLGTPRFETRETEP